MVGFIGRDITGRSQLKYYISESLPKRFIIYNYENIKDKDTIIIVEGNIDLIKTFKYNPISLFGTSLSNQQLNLLQQLPYLKNIVIGLDPDTKIFDKKGRSQYIKLIEQLKPFWTIWEIDLKEKKDLGECSFDEVDEIFNNKTQLKNIELSLNLK
jgi:5S rRNA maturation endonuclease (ribonuclease M5)